VSSCLLLSFGLVAERSREYCLQEADLGFRIFQLLAVDLRRFFCRHQSSTSYALFSMKQGYDIMLSITCLARTFMLSCTPVWIQGLSLRSPSITASYHPSGFNISSITLTPPRHPSSPTNAWTMETSCPSTRPSSVAYPSRTASTPSTYETRITMVVGHSGRISVAYSWLSVRGLWIFGRVFLGKVRFLSTSSSFAFSYHSLVVVQVHHLPFHSASI
jgi:hypothetical protein